MCAGQLNSLEVGLIPSLSPILEWISHYLFCLESPHLGSRANISQLAWLVVTRTNVVEKEKRNRKTSTFCATAVLLPFTPGIKRPPSPWSCLVDTEPLAPLTLVPGRLVLQAQPNLEASLTQMRSSDLPIWQQ